MRAPSFRICRRIGAQLVNVESPLTGRTLSLHAKDADTALMNARQLGITGSLVAVPEAN